MKTATVVLNLVEMVTHRLRLTAREEFAMTEEEGVEIQNRLMTALVELKLAGDVVHRVMVRAGDRDVEEIQEFMDLLVEVEDGFDVDELMKYMLGHPFVKGGK